jgi:hypothetical protein
LATAMSTVIHQLVRSQKTHQHHHHTRLITHSVAQNICAPFVGTEPVGNIMACTGMWYQEPCLSQRLFQMEEDVTKSVYIRNMKLDGFGGDCMPSCSCNLHIALFRKLNEVTGRKCCMFR